MAVSTSAWTDSREETSTVAVLTSKPGVAQHLRRGVGVLVAQVGQHDMLAGADAPGDRLTDRSCSDDDDDLAHEELLTWGCWGKALANPA